MLIDCRADVNLMDNSRNTVLHICAENLRGLVDEKDVKEMESILDVLLKSGAHIDCRNKAGKIAGEELHRSKWYRLCIIDHISLKCLSARAVQLHEIPYEGEVPHTLCPFIKLHW